jgi:small-conductance mechanosensitive channel
MINETFTKHGIEISFPQMDIHMRADSELALRKQDTFSSEQLPQE